MPIPNRNSHIHLHIHLHDGFKRGGRQQPRRNRLSAPPGVTFAAKEKEPQQCAVCNRDLQLSVLEGILSEASS